MAPAERATTSLPDSDIAVVGGGVSGLYCALQLSRLIKENRPLHVIGDAYSDYQGFIEGALRSAARVISYFVTGQAETEFSDRVFLAANAFQRDSVSDR